MSISILNLPIELIFEIIRQIVDDYYKEKNEGLLYINKTGGIYSLRKNNPTWLMLVCQSFRHIVNDIINENPGPHILEKVEGGFRLGGRAVLCRYPIYHPFNVVNSSMCYGYLLGLGSEYEFIELSSNICITFRNFRETSKYIRYKEDGEIVKFGYHTVDGNRLYYITTEVKIFHTRSETTANVLCDLFQKWIKLKIPVAPTFDMNLTASTHVFPACCIYEKRIRDGRTLHRYLELNLKGDEM